MSLAQGQGRPVENNVVVSLHSTLGRFSGFSKPLDVFSSQILGIYKTSPSLQRSAPFLKPFVPWLLEAERFHWGRWALTETAFPTLWSFVIPKQVFLLFNVKPRHSKKLVELNPAWKCVLLFYIPEILITRAGFMPLALRYGLEPVFWRGCCRGCWRSQIPSHPAANSSSKTCLHLKRFIYVVKLSAGE